jgi:hypothetical protein
MRRFLLFVLSIATLQALATPVETGYHPMLQDGKVWNYTAHLTTGDEPFRIVITGDTVISHQKFCKLCIDIAGQRRLYSCFREEGGELAGYVLSTLQEKDGHLNVIENGSSLHTYYYFNPDVTWVTWHYSQYFHDYMQWATGNAKYFPFKYELISVNGLTLARLSLNQGRSGQAETWFSGVGDSRWGIMVPQNSSTSPNVELESCVEAGRLLYSKADLSLEPMPCAYYPFLEEGKVWTTQGSSGIYRNYLQGDSVIDGHHGMKLFSENENNDGEVHYKGVLYEEDCRVYWYRPGQKESCLLYDFAIPLGESVELDEWTVKVEEAGTVCEIGPAGLIRSHIVMRQSDPCIWMEGVGAGFEADVTKPLEFFRLGDNIGEGVLDCSVDDRIIYRANSYNKKVGASVFSNYKWAVDGKTWNYIHYYKDESGTHEEPYSYVVRGDTIVNGDLLCKKVYRCDGNGERLYCVLYEFGNLVRMQLAGNTYWNSLFHFWRDDFGRVFTWGSRQGRGTVCWTPHHADVVSVGGRDYRRFVCYQTYVNDPSEAPDAMDDGEGVWHDIWVEGIGGRNTGIELPSALHEPLQPSDDYSLFVSCYEDGICIFTREDFSDDSADDIPVLPGGEGTVGMSVLSGKAGGTVTHDLQGRRVQGKPAKGVYIRGGRKVVVK